MAFNSGRYYRQLLGGWQAGMSTIDAAEALDLTLADAGGLGSWKALFGLPGAREWLFSDDLAMEILAYTSTGLAAILSSEGARIALLENTSAYAVLSALVNDSDSFLIRRAYTSGSGNMTDVCIAGYVLIQSPGGNGGNGSVSFSGQGGTGGETVGQQLTLTQLATPIAYNIGAVGSTNASFGALSAIRGVSGTASTSTNSGPGTTETGGGAEGLISATPATAIWQRKSFKNKGGDGGAGTSTGSVGVAGTVGAAGAGGAAASGGGGFAGTGLGSGGGSGQYVASNTNGQAASANTGCGGGGAARNTGTGGAAGTGSIYFYGVKARP